jgi:hypothetical protein
MGEGGAVNIARTCPLKTLVESFRDWGRDCWCESGKDNTCGRRFEWKQGELPKGYDHKYIYSHLGYNLKPLDIQAAIGREQLKRLPQFVALRRQNWQRLRPGLSEFSDCFDFMDPPRGANPPGSDSCCSSRTRPRSRRSGSPATSTKKIGNRRLFGGNLVRQPAFVQLRHDNAAAFRVVGDLKGADRLMNSALFVGVYPGLTPAMLDYVIETIGTYCRSAYPKAHPIQMKTVILCGGKGTRLREETEYRPKPMVPIGSRPILWHIMQRYARYGHKEFVLCLGYKGDVIKEYFRNYRWNSHDVTVSLDGPDEPRFHDPTARRTGRSRSVDTGARIADRVAGPGRPRPGRPRALLPDLRRRRGRHRPKEASFLPPQIGSPLHLDRRPSSGPVWGDSNGHRGRVESFNEKPQTETGYINGGFMVCEQELFDHLPDDPLSMLEEAPLRSLRPRANSPPTGTRDSGSPWIPTRSSPS